MQEGSFLSLVPPAVVLVMGFYSRRVLLSLSAGILVAALIATGFSPVQAVSMAATGFWDSLELGVMFNPATFWDSWNSFICLFLVILGVFITLIHRSGGAWAYEKFIVKRLKFRKQVESSSLLMSACLCIDDYFSSLTVGSVMHPITDSYRIPRAKLAFLVDAMAAPLAVLCPVSSWVAAIVGFLRDNGVHAQAGEHTKVLASPFLTYINIIPYIFYSFVIIFGAWFIVLKGISFGLMGQHETCARETGNVFNGKKSHRSSLKKPSGDLKERASLADFFVPVIILVAAILLGILHSGSWSGMGGTRSLFDALREASAASGLLAGGLVALLFTLCFYLFRGKILVTQLPAIAKEGIVLMGPSCMVLILAWTLGGLLRDNLATGQYLADLLVGNMPSELIPVMFFVTSVVISFSIGSAWGTAAIMFPIGVQLVLAVSGVSLPASLDLVPLLFPTLGAVLSGCVAGDHISPISDTTIMSSTSTSMEHIDHVETQMTYALPLILITGVAFLFLGYALSLGSSAALSLGMLMIAVLVSVIMSFLNRNKRTNNHDVRAADSSSPSL